MAYVKFKELTHYYNFSKKIDEKKLPDYVYQYISKDEEVLAVFCTMRDKVVFTSRKLILFDVKGLFRNTKTIEMFPHNKMCSYTIIFGATSVYISFTLLSGYKMRLNFVKLSPEGKAEIRKLFYSIYEGMDK